LNNTCTCIIIKQLSVTLDDYYKVARTSATLVFTSRPHCSQCRPLY